MSSQKAVVKKPVTIGKMKKQITLLFLFTGLVVAATLVLSTKSKNAQAEQVQEIPIPVFLKALSRGDKVEQSNLSFVKWDRSKIPASSILISQGMVGKVANQEVPAMLPIASLALVESTNDVNRVVERIPQGMRAITVKVDVESAVEGWAQSGNRVDVLVVRNSNNNLEAKIIAENVQILSSGRSTESKISDEAQPKTPNTATLLVSQDDALKIKAASTIGRITFALRGGDDNEPAQTTKVDQKMIFGEANSKRELKGLAKSPDGKTYVLRGASRWMESALPQENLTVDENKAEKQKPE